MCIEGLIPLAAGIYLGLIAYRIIPDDSRHAKAWRAPWRTVMKVLAPFLVLFGAVELAGVFESHAGPTIDKEELSKKLAATPLGQ
jgi:hypothetical protein